MSVVETLTGDLAGTGDVEFRWLPVDQLVPHAQNVRRDVGDITELAASIKAGGIHEPLIVQPNGEPDRWVILAGHRRHAAAPAAGLGSVPCLIRRDLDEVAQLTLMLTENTQRADLTPVEEADGVQGLLDLGLSDRAIAASLGWSTPKVRRRKKIGKLATAVKAKLVAPGNEVPMTLADAEFLASVTDPDDVDELVDAIGTRQWAVTRHIVTARTARRQHLDQIHREAKKLGIASGTFTESIAARADADGRSLIRLAKCHWADRTAADVESAQQDDTVAIVEVSTALSGTGGLWYDGKQSPAVLTVWGPDPAADQGDADATAPEVAGADASGTDSSAPQDYPGGRRTEWEKDQEREREERAAEAACAANAARAAAREAATAVRREFISELIINGTDDAATQLAAFALCNADDWSEYSSADLFKYLPAGVLDLHLTGEQTAEQFASMYPTRAAGLASSWFVTQPNRLRVLAAAQAAMLLESIELTIDYYDPARVDEDEGPQVVEYLDLLADLGHVLSDVEVEYRNAIADALPAADEDA